MWISFDAALFSGCICRHMSSSECTQAFHLSGMLRFTAAISTTLLPACWVGSDRYSPFVAQKYTHTPNANTSLRSVMAGRDEVLKTAEGAESAAGARAVATGVVWLGVPGAEREDDKAARSRSRFARSLSLSSGARVTLLLRGCIPYFPPAVSSLTLTATVALVAAAPTAGLLPPCRRATAAAMRCDAAGCSDWRSIGTGTSGRSITSTAAAAVRQKKGSAPADAHLLLCWMRVFVVLYVLRPRRSGHLGPPVGCCCGRQQSSWKLSF